MRTVNNQIVLKNIYKNFGNISALKDVSMMKDVDIVTGPFDIIAVAEADDLPSIGDLISDGMHSIPGIVKTITCLSVRS